MNYKVEFLFLFLGFHVVFSQRKSCTGGSCTSLENCPRLLDLARNNSQIGQILRKYRCGIQNGVTLFCCNNDETIAGRSGVVDLGSDSNTDTDQLFFPSDDKTKVSVNSRISESDAIRLLPQDCGQYTPTLSRISGGRDTKFHEFPWMALFQYRDQFGYVHLTCGGSLINNRYVLTAAHCLNRQGWTLELIRLGDYHKKTIRDCINVNGQLTCADDPKYVGIEETIVHEKYEPHTRNQYHDIGLVRLSQPVTFTRNVKPICLSAPLLGGNFVTIGWGQLGAGIIESDVLQKVEVALVERKLCQELHDTVSNLTQIMEGQICAGGMDGKDVCQGDSGGPLMQLDNWINGTPRWEIVGIASWGSPFCGSDGIAGIYTDVSFYLSWIYSKLRP